MPIFYSLAPLFLLCISAHFVGMALPSDDEVDGDETLEAWYVDQVFAMTKAKAEHKILLKKLPDEPPNNVASKMSDYIKQTGSNQAAIRVQITNTPTTDPEDYQHQYSLKYFAPTIVNYVGRSTDARSRRKRKTKEVNLEGYGVCLTNTDKKRPANVVFDVVLVSEDILDDDAAVSESGFKKEEHLTPLEESLDQSISAANSVLREMKYMEKREARMRKTADSINSRVRWFSYLSVSVLLTVTYIQVSYLKRYFHKKKLM